MTKLKIVTKSITVLASLLIILNACAETDEEKTIKPHPVEIAAKKACDCQSVSVKESNTNGKTSIELTVVKTTFPDFQKRTTQIMKQIAKDVEGFCDADEIIIHYISNTYNIPDRSVFCECPEERKPQAADSIMVNLNSGIRCKSSSSRIVRRDTGQKVLILAFRDLDETTMSDDEVVDKLKNRLKIKYPSLCDSINEVTFEFYTGENGYLAHMIDCQDVYN